MCPGLRCTPRTCSVEVGAAAKPKKIILQTEQQMGRSPVWDSKAQATLFQSDVLQFLGQRLIDFRSLQHIAAYSSQANACSMTCMEPM
jgi:hypothetical protein